MPAQTLNSTTTAEPEVSFDSEELSAERADLLDQIDRFIGRYQERLNFEVPTFVTAAIESQIANKHAVCHAVTHSAAILLTSAHQRESGANDSDVEFGAGVSQRRVELEASGQKLVAASDVTPATKSQPPIKKRLVTPSRILLKFLKRNQARY